MKPNELTHEIIGASIEVHRELGPGKSEPAYESALSCELDQRGLAHSLQRPVPVVYKGMKLDCGYRLDVLARETVVVEVKAVAVIHPVHRAQLLTYLRLGGWKLGLLINFHVALLKEGIERFVLGLPEAGANASGPSKPDSDRSLAAVPLLHATTDCGDPDSELFAREVIAAGLEVHRELGVGLLASAYRAAFIHELRLRGIELEVNHPLPLTYKGIGLNATDHVELLVGGRVLVQCHAVDTLESVHAAALFSQLRLGAWRLGLLLNFNTINFSDGIRRVVSWPR